MRARREKVPTTGQFRVPIGPMLTASLDTDLLAVPQGPSFCGFGKGPKIVEDGVTLESIRKLAKILTRSRFIRSWQNLTDPSVGKLFPAVEQ
jgi:hypothetical protein